MAAGLNLGRSSEGDACWSESPYRIRLLEESPVISEASSGYKAIINSASGVICLIDFWLVTEWFGSKRNRAVIDTSGSASGAFVVC